MAAFCARSFSISGIRSFGGVLGAYLLIGLPFLGRREVIEIHDRDFLLVKLNTTLNTTLIFILIVLDLISNILIQLY